MSPKVRTFAAEKTTIYIINNVMKLFDSFKVCLLGLAASTALVACDDNDDNKSPEYVGSYAGELVVSGEFNGRTMFEGTVAGELKIENVNSTTVDITVPEIVDLNAGRSIYSVKPFVVSDVKVERQEEGYTFRVDSLAIDEVYCDQGDGNGYCTFNSIVCLNGTYANGKANVTYTFSLGKMPFPLKGEFEGIKK